MGRLKVYGGSWNLPGVRDLPNPFAGHLLETPETVTGFAPLVTPKSTTTPVVEIPVVERPVEKTVTQGPEVPLHTSGAETSSRYIRADIILGGVLIHYSVYN